jgi:hypothetical protein
MATNNKPEVWLRGPLNNIPALLQPVAHALLQAREELNELMNDFPDSLLWQKIAGMASPGFHLQHMAGVLNRLFTYANGEMLTAYQLSYLAAEGKPSDKIDSSIQQLSETDVSLLTEARGVGRAQLPSTVIGLYVHSAEHTMRHLGQLLVTIKILKMQNAV